MIGSTLICAGDFTFTDVESDPLASVTITNQLLSGGTLELSGATVNNGHTILAANIGNLVYTPLGDANGLPLATFDFTANDAGTGVVSAQMDIDVTADNDVPVATANTILVANISNLVYTPLGNANGLPLATFDFTAIVDRDAT